MTRPSQRFNDPFVWQKAHEFVKTVYKYSANFPKKEKFGLTSQFRRASVSIAANIAEGYIKKGALDKVRFLDIAQGSLEECRYYLILSFDLGFGSNEQLSKLSDEVDKLLNSYINGILRKKSS